MHKAVMPQPKIALCSEDDDDDFIKLDVTKTFFHQAYSSFNQFRMRGEMCDVALIAEGKRLFAHKVVLSAAIPYFQAMFTSDMMEANQRDIIIQEMEYETMELLIAYAYTGELRITSGNVQSLMIGANFLQLLDVVNNCSGFLLSRLHSSNVLNIRSFCTVMGSDSSMMKKADKFLQMHFIYVSKGDEFLNLDASTLVEILNWDELYVDSEEEVFAAAIRWLQYDIERHPLSSSILSCVRMPLLKPSFLSDVVATHRLVKEDLTCRDLVDEAKDYHLMPERRSTLKSFRIQPRHCNGVPGYIFALGGLMKNVECRSSAEIYDPCTKVWTAASEMKHIRTRVGVAACSKQLYVIGGFNGHDRLRVVEMYDYLTDKWTTVYDPDRNVWEDGPPMSKQRSASGVAVLDGFLYVIGGHDGMIIFNTVERYDVERNVWEAMPPMSTKRCRLGATTYNGKIYVCGGYDGTSFLRSVECFDVKTMQWAPVTPMNICRSRVALVANVDGLYAIAGFDGENNLCSVEVYTAETDCWQLSTPLQTHEGGVGVGVIPIPPSLI